MSGDAVLHQREHRIETLAIPNPTSETAARDDLDCAVARWLGAEGTRTRRFTSSVHILWREFRNWSGLECAQAEFVARLERRGLVVDRGMVDGLALNEDFLADFEYERLRSRKAVQLDLFNATSQDGNSDGSATATSEPQGRGEIADG
jgi:hypothetical protein